MKTKQQVVSEFRRREILDASRKVFARKGFTDGIVDDIAAEAGLAKGTIYLYFRSKNDIYLALVEHDMEALKTGTLQKIDAATGTKEKIRAFILARLENAENNRELFRVMDSPSAGMSISRTQYRDWLKDPVLHLAAVIERAQKNGEIRMMPSERLAWTVADIARGAILRRLLEQPSSSISEEAEFLVDLVWAALQPEGPSTSR
jgi:AcrR family transcriptional regulator